MYKEIDKRPTIRDSYLQRLLKLDGISEADANKIAEDRREILQAEFDAARVQSFQSDIQAGAGVWEGFYGGIAPTDGDSETGVPTGKLTYIINKSVEVPQGFQVNRKLERVLGRRKEIAAGKQPVDWATAELAAFGSLAIEGHRVRITGQDVGRGTFSHRHAVLHDGESGERFCSLQHISDDQAGIEIVNSPLCEAGVLGFEYGYSLDSPNDLILWEAQFGDFWNVAQVIVDQFITSAEDKWKRLSGLVMLLPHGFEGQGPEHCSARVERFLTLAAESNIQICNPTSAAQYFHLLRRQVKCKWRKPLVVLTPKSLLREPLVTSPLEALCDGGFQAIVEDPEFSPKKKVSRVLITNGKIGVDLQKARTELGRSDLALIRLEQLYPLPAEELRKALQKYPSDVPVYWVQEEPRNMGAWYFMKVKWDEFGLEQSWKLHGVCRPESASPSTGSKKMHKIEQDELIAEAMGKAASGSASQRSPANA